MSRVETSLLGRSKPYVEQLTLARLSAITPSVDPWIKTLRTCLGVTGADGIERLSSSEVLDRLAVPNHLRARSAKRLTRVMIDLGWRPMRVRAVNAHGFASRLRGFARTSGNPENVHTNIASC
jgi:hypothetical protein